MTALPEVTAEELSRIVVVSYQWQDNGAVTITLSWAPARRACYSVPADQFNEATIHHLRTQLARDVKAGRIR